VTRFLPSLRSVVMPHQAIANLCRTFQALRRSIKGDKDKGAPISIAPKSAIAIVPPKKVGFPEHISARSPGRRKSHLFKLLAVSPFGNLQAN
jgi:hypothetical protein